MEITVELLQEMIREKQIKRLREIFDEYNIVNLAEMVEALSLEEALFLFKILRNEITGVLFSYFDAEHQEKLIETFTSNEIQNILDNLYSDDITEFMEELPANLVRKVLIAATPEQRKEINLSLSYPENSAGSIMSTDFVELKQGDTIGQAIRKIKRQGRVAEVIDDCYIVDSARRLVGMVELESILFQEEDDLIDEYMKIDFVFVNTHDDQESVALEMQHYDLMAIPVVNDDQCFIGIITIDDIMDIMEEEVTEDIHKMAAITPIEDSYLQATTFSMVKSRVTWLMLMMLFSLLAEGILAQFEETLAIIPALAAFVPMIMGTAGNAGNQSSVMIIREISLKEVEIKDFWKVLTIESKVSFWLGVILFVASMARILLLPPSVSLDIGLIASVSLVISLFFANVFGAVLPLFAILVKQDPAAMAAPLITSVVDAFALIIYFSLCVGLLGIAM